QLIWGRRRRAELSRGYLLHIRSHENHGQDRDRCNRAAPCEARAKEIGAAPEVALNALVPRLRQSIDTRDNRVREAEEIRCGKVQSRSDRPQLAPDGRIV